MSIELLQGAVAVAALIVLLVSYRIHVARRRAEDAALVAGMKARALREDFPPCTACGYNRVGAYCARCGASKEKRETLTPGTIMARSADGKLRPYKPGDEPAGILLQSGCLSYRVTPADVLARHGDRVVSVRENYRRA